MKRLIPAALGAALLLSGCRPPGAGEGQTTIPSVDSTSGRTKMQFWTRPVQLEAGQPGLWNFKIFDPKKNKGARDLQFVGDKLLAVGVLSSDLEFFNLLFPDYKDYGHFLKQTTLPHPGGYRVFADFQRLNQPRDEASQVTTVSNSTASAEAARPQAAQLVADKGIVTGTSLRLARAGYQLDEVTGAKPVSDRLQLTWPRKLMANQEEELSLSLSPEAPLQQLFGGAGYLLIVGQDGKQQVRAVPNPHAAPGRKAASFLVRFPRPGHYRIWATVRHPDSRLLAAPFTIRVQ